MARLQGLILFFTLLVAVYGAATPTHYKPQFCKNHHGSIQKIRNSFAYPREFCQWFNSAKRVNSPLIALPAAQVINGCECINQKAHSKVPTDFTSPDDFEPVCDNSLKRKLAGITYANPKNFCKFWGNGEGTHFRRISPFHKQGMTNMDVYNACACYNLFVAAPTETITTATTDATETATATSDTVTSATETQLPEITNTILPEITNTILPEITNTLLPEITNTLLPEITNTLLPEITNTILPEITNTLIPVVTKTVVPEITTVVLAPTVTVTGA